MEKKRTEWTKEDLSKLTASHFSVLAVFIDSKKTLMKSSELKPVLEKQGWIPKKVGGTLASFYQFKEKEHLLQPVMRMAQKDVLWEFNEKYRTLIFKKLGQVRKYLK